MKRSEVQVGKRYGTEDIGEVVVISTSAERRGCVSAVQAEDWPAFEAMTTREGDEFIRTDVSRSLPNVWWVPLGSLSTRAR